MINLGRSTQEEEEAPKHESVKLLSGDSQGHSMDTSIEEKSF